MLAPWSHRMHTTPAERLTTFAPGPGTTPLILVLIGTALQEAEGLHSLLEGSHDHPAGNHARGP